MNKTPTKLKHLKKLLIDMKKVLVAFSAGVDSTFLLKVAMDTLGSKNILAVTAVSETYPQEELKDALSFAKRMGLNGRHRIIKTSELKINNFSKNSPNRCFHCKLELFSKMKELARKNRISFVLDGSNFSDQDDYRPGRKALNRLNIRSPLLEAELSKEDIRILSRKLGLPTWNKPANACLSSRIPYGEKITIKKLKRIEKAEKYLHSMGFTQLRVRDHRDIARLELAPTEIKKLMKKNLREKIHNRLRGLGFKYITIDILGYRTGSLNEVLKRKKS